VAASAAGRLVARIRRPFRRRASIGWNPLEPACLGFTMILLVASIVAPWWGTSKSTFDFRYSITRVETVQFSPWLTTHWYSSVAPSFFVLQADPILWWEFPRFFPAYARYVSVSGVLCGLWSAAFVISAIAMWARGAPRRRFAGLPTAGEAVVAGLVGAAILTSSFLFPSTAGYSSFSGVSTDGSFQWGPGLGWYFAFAAVTLAAYAAVVGFLVDRKLVGICWFCYRPATGPRCTYCGSILRRSRSERNRGGPTAESVAAPKQK